MANITYARNFQHVDWVDNEDIVQAGGENGFNIRFHALETEFDRLSAVIGQINAALVPVSPVITLTFAPSFIQNLTSPAWAQNNGIAAKGLNQTSADGYMQVQLPDGLNIQNMTVTGEKSGNVGSFTVQLVRQSLTGALTTLLTIPLADKPDSFQFTDQVPANVSLIDNKANKYLVTARVIGADATATVKLFAIQILCARS